MTNDSKEFLFFYFCALLSFPPVHSFQVLYPIGNPFWLSFHVVTLAHSHLKAVRVAVMLKGRSEREVHLWGILLMPAGKFSFVLILFNRESRAQGHLQTSWERVHVLFKDASAGQMPPDASLDPRQSYWRVVSLLTIMPHRPCLAACYAKSGIEKVRGYDSLLLITPPC